VALTNAERKRAERARKKKHDRMLGMASVTMRLAETERALIVERTKANGCDDKAEYLLSLVYAERDKSQNTKGTE